MNKTEEAHNRLKELLAQVKSGEKKIELAVYTKGPISEEVKKRMKHCIFSSDPVDYADSGEYIYSGISLEESGGVRVFLVTQSLLEDF
jgi:hypothetical protein